MRKKDVKKLESGEDTKRVVCFVRGLNKVPLLLEKKYERERVAQSKGKPFFFLFKQGKTEKEKKKTGLRKKAAFYYYLFLFLLIS